MWAPPDRPRGLHSAIAFTHRARVWFAAHGITTIERIVTDNGASCRADTFARALLGARHQRVTPYTPRHNGEAERYNRILAEEFLYVRSRQSERQRSDALRVWNVHYNHHRPQGAAGNRPPAIRLPLTVTNVLSSYDQVRASASRSALDRRR
ncbi:transposase [Streptomyces sp. SID4985]|nr:transposase [Streptomyces sp. SID4985]